MAFPASPTDKQTYTTALNTFYQYDSTRQAWLINSAGAGTYYGTSSTPPSATGLSDGSLYVQYSA